MGLESWADTAVKSRALRAQTLSYQLRDESSHLVVWLPNRHDIGVPGNGMEWRRTRFFRPDQEAKARQLAEALRGLEPIQTAWVAQASNQHWYVQVKLSRQWQTQQGIHPPEKPNPTPYSRVLPKAQALELPTWYAEARADGYQSLCFKYGEDWLLVHLPQALVVGEEGKGKWEDCYFFEAKEEAERFAEAMEAAAKGLATALVNSTNDYSNPRYFVRVGLDVSAAVLTPNP